MPIKRDHDGFLAIGEDEVLYVSLPIIVMRCISEEWEEYMYEYIDEDNWHESLGDLEKAEYKYYFKCPDLRDVTHETNT